MSATYEAAKNGKPLVISIGQFGRLELANKILAAHCLQSSERDNIMQWAEENSKDMGSYFEVRTGEGVGGLVERIRAAIAASATTKGE